MISRNSKGVFKLRFYSSNAFVVSGFKELLKHMKKF